MKHTYLVIISLSFVLAFSGCFGSTSYVTPEDLNEENTATTQTPRMASWEGVLKPVSNTLIAEGTHVLVSDDNEFIAELFSNTIDLSMYVNKNVQLTGIANENSGHTLIEVTKITKTDSDALVDLWDILPDMATEYDDSIEWNKAVFELLDSSETAGTATIIATTEDDMNYTIKLVRKDDPLVGDFEVYSIYESTESELEVLNEDEDIDEDEDADEEEESTEIIESKPVVIDPKVQESSVNETLLSDVLVTLPGFLKNANDYETVPTITKLEFTSPNFLYVQYVAGDTSYMELLTYSKQDSGIAFANKASFAKGETTDWEIISGVNSAKNLAKDIFIPQSGAWVFQGNVEEGYTLYDWNSIGVQFEVPYSWYYWVKGTSIAFSNQPVEEENTLAEVFYSTKSVDDALSTFTGTVSAESNVTIGDYSGIKQTLDDGTLRYAVDYGNTVLIVETSSETASTVEFLLSSVSLK